MRNSKKANAKSRQVKLNKQIKALASKANKQ